MKKKHDENLLRSAVERLLRPLIKFCVRNCINIQDFFEITKAVYVQESKKFLSNSKSKVNVTRVSAMSGLRRKEVQRLYDNPTPQKKHRGFTSRIVTRWITDEEFSDKNGNPKKLTCKGTDSEFYKLCFKETTEVTPRSILNHLVSTELVSRTEDILILQQECYTPTGAPLEGFEFVGLDIGDLVKAAENNILMDENPKNLHLTTDYDELLVESKDEIKEWLLREGGDFHKRVRSYLAQFEIPKEKETKDKNKVNNMLRVVVGTFSRTHKITTKD